MKAARMAVSVGIVGAVLALYRLFVTVNHTTVALSLLLAILGISARWGLAEATVASLAAVLGFNYLFLPPQGTFTIEDPQNWVALLAFLATAVTASQLAERAQRRAAEAEARRLDIERLYALVRAMMPSGDVHRTIREFVSRVSQTFGCGGAAFYYAPEGETFRSGSETEAVTDHDLRASAETHGVGFDENRGLALAPVRLGMRPLGSMALLAPVPSEQVLRSIADLAAITVEKARALEEANRAAAARQSEALKSALLDSLAHDIKTPLTSIKAAATSLLGLSTGPDRELLTVINEEADRLNQIAAEVVAMARVEAGKLHLDRRRMQPAEVVAAALAEVAQGLRARPVEVKAPRDLPEADADPELICQVLKLLLENALKYSPEGSPIGLSAELRDGKIVIGVSDRGPGIEEDERIPIFEKFFRGRRQRFDTRGTGMGLAIARGIVEAHGERIWVESEVGQGSVFYFTLAVASGGREA